MRWWRVVGSMLVLAMIGPASNGSLCPSRCLCDDEILKVSCASASLEVVPIQLNPDVRHIDISDNKIDNVHFTLSFYTNLITLDMSNNKIHTLGSGNFVSQKSLEYLYLNNNELNHLGKDCFKGLRGVKHLDLSFNRLDELGAAAFRDLHSLESLKLTGNQLIYIADGVFKSAKNLQKLLLDDNHLMMIPSGALIDAINLEYLSLSGNLLETVNISDIPNLLQLRTLLLDKNVINEVHHSALSSLFTLNYLDLSDNNFTTVPTDSLVKLSNLTKLKFGGNFVKRIPPVAFRGLFQLRYLHLDRLELLQKVDVRAFVDNLNLEKVWLDDNIGVEKLPTRIFHGNPKIYHISIRNNKLVTLDASHFPLDQLRRLKLGGNPLECNCSLLWLWHLTQEQKLIQNGNVISINETEKAEDLEIYEDLLIDLEDIRCAGPEPLSNILLADAKESEIDCALNWLATVSITATVFLVSMVLAVVLYWNTLRKIRSKEAHISENCRNKPVSTCSNGRNEIVHNSMRSDKCIMSSSMVPHQDDYRGFTPWDPYNVECGGNSINIYEQLDRNTKTRPHVVYV